MQKVNAFIFKVNIPQILEREKNDHEKVLIGKSNGMPAHCGDCRGFVVYEVPLPVFRCCNVIRVLALAEVKSSNQKSFSVRIN